MGRQKPKGIQLSPELAAIIVAIAGLVLGWTYFELGQLQARIDRIEQSTHSQLQRLEDKREADKDNLAETQKALELLKQRIEDNAGN